MTELLSESDPCGQQLLALVSRGHAIIAELQRLANVVPPVFRLDTKRDKTQYGDLMFDFNYFSHSDAINSKIESNEKLLDLDEELRENYSEIVTRFFRCFESVYKYAVDLNRFVDDLENGGYIHQTLETVFLYDDGKQLMCEALFLYGVMLLFADWEIEGVVRERLLVAHYRFSGHRSAGGSNVDDVCRLLRSCPGQRWSNGYPEDLFRRVPVSESFVKSVVGKLRSDDVYNQVRCYPSADHRSVALASQASLLFVTLFFTPTMLRDQAPRMREVVDKFFPDNWVVDIYMGKSVCLVEAWDSFRAARSALSNNLEPRYVRTLAGDRCGAVAGLLDQTQARLRQGHLTREVLLDEGNRILNLLRDCNACLRWLTLHALAGAGTGGGGSSGGGTCRASMQLRDTVVKDANYSAARLTALLLDTAELELRVRDTYKSLLSEKEDKWKSTRQECVERMTELADVLSGTKPLTKVEKNESLERWCRDIASRLAQLEYASAGPATAAATGRKLIQIVEALREVGELPQADQSAQVKQWIEETAATLKYMLRLLTLKEEFLVTLQVVGDLSYAWELYDGLVPEIQKLIAENPAIVAKLRATFLKLSSAMDMPLLRINQARSPDLISVSRYYSGEVANRVRTTLQIVPECMFRLLGQVMDVLTNKMPDVPTRLDKDRLRDFARPEDRFLVARLTDSISLFSQGILLMKTTLVGVVELDPKRLLEDGIRKELVKRLAWALHSGLRFSNAPDQKLARQLAALGRETEGFRRSFEYMQDYVDLPGLRIWQEELSRIVNYNVEQECNLFVRNKVLDYQSVYQSRTVPIPRLPPSSAESATFVGALARELLRLTDPKATLWLESVWTWFEARTVSSKTGATTALVSGRALKAVRDSVGTAGLYGLRRILGFMLVKELQEFLAQCERQFVADRPVKEALDEMAKGMQWRTATALANRHWKSWSTLLDSLARVGQMQVLRVLAAHELEVTCRADAQHLAASLDTLNRALVTDLRRKQRQREKDRRLPVSGWKETEDGRIGPDNPLLFDVASFADHAGMVDSNKIFVTVSNSELRLPLVIAVLVSHAAGKQWTYMRTVDKVVPKKHDGGTSDPSMVAHGIATVFHQLHPDNLRLFLRHLSSFSCYQFERGTGSADVVPVDATVVSMFVDQVAKAAGLDRHELETLWPKALLDFSRRIFNHGLVNRELIRKKVELHKKIKRLKEAKLLKQLDKRLAASEEAKNAAIVNTEARKKKKKKPALSKRKKKEKLKALMNSHVLPGAKKKKEKKKKTLPEETTTTTSSANGEPEELDAQCERMEEEEAVKEEEEQQPGAPSEPPEASVETDAKTKKKKQRWARPQDEGVQEKTKRKVMRRLREAELACCISIAVPGSVIDNAQSAELRSYVAGQIARAATIYRVDEVIVYDDTKPTTTSASTENGCEERYTKREDTDYEEDAFRGGFQKGRGAVQLARILQYLECPQYLRRALFPVHPDLKYAGLLNPLDAPHHMRRDEASPYREGVVLDRPHKGDGSLVDVGLDRPARVDKKLVPGTRVTVSMQQAGRGKLVSPRTPRETHGLYWGYEVRYETGGLSKVLQNSARPNERYDVKIGTSDAGTDVTALDVSRSNKGDAENARRLPHRILIVFGGLDGLETAIENDAENLRRKDKDATPTDIFDHYVNVCPEQGSRTIRTEEAVFIALARIVPAVANVFRDWQNVTASAESDVWKSAKFRKSLQDQVLTELIRLCSGSMSGDATSAQNLSRTARIAVDAACDALLQQEKKKATTTKQVLYPVPANAPKYSATPKDVLERMRSVTQERSDVPTYSPAVAPPSTGSSSPTPSMQHQQLLQQVDEDNASQYYDSQALFIEENPVEEDESLMCDSAKDVKVFAAPLPPEKAALPPRKKIVVNTERPIGTIRPLGSVSTTRIDTLEDMFCPVSPDIKLFKAPLPVVVAATATKSVTGGAKAADAKSDTRVPVEEEQEPTLTQQMQTIHGSQMKNEGMRSSTAAKGSSEAGQTAAADDLSLTQKLEDMFDQASPRLPLPAPKPIVIKRDPDLIDMDEDEALFHEDYGIDYSTMEPADYYDADMEEHVLQAKSGPSFEEALGSTAAPGSRKRARSSSSSAADQAFDKLRKTENSGVKKDEDRRHRHNSSKSKRHSKSGGGGGGGSEEDSKDHRRDKKKHKKKRTRDVSSHSHSRSRTKHENKAPKREAKQEEEMKKKPKMEAVTKIKKRFVSAALREKKKARREQYKTFRTTLTKMNVLWDTTESSSDSSEEEEALLTSDEELSADATDVSVHNHGKKQTESVMNGTAKRSVDSPVRAAPAATTAAATTTSTITTTVVEPPVPVVAPKKCTTGPGRSPQVTGCAFFVGGRQPHPGADGRHQTPTLNQRRAKPLERKRLASVRDSGHGRRGSLGEASAAAAAAAAKPSQKETKPCPPPKRVPTVTYSRVTPTGLSVTSRQERLEKLYVALYDADPFTATAQAVAQEESVCIKSKTKQSYLSNMTNAILSVRKLNDDKKNKSMGGSSGGLGVSHAEILAGKNGQKNSWSVEKKRAPMDENVMRNVFYELLLKYKLTDDQLRDLNFPRPDPDDPHRARFPGLENDLERRKLHENLVKFKKNPEAMPRRCVRCGKAVTVDKNLVPIGDCSYHPKRSFSRRGPGGIEKTYLCCNMDFNSDGCSSADKHVVDLFDPWQQFGYCSTKPESGHGGPQQQTPQVYAVDCEMVYTTQGVELARVTVVDYDGGRKYDALVKPPNIVLDYNTRFSGITEGDLDSVTRTLGQVQKELREFISAETMLLGHSLESDLKALKMIHGTVVDTSIVWPHNRGLPFKKALRTLCQDMLGDIIQNEGAGGHDSLEDAYACMKLMKKRANDDLQKAMRN
ncbi:unnamed protein product [Notodromas monacha]|uniref:Exonuclease domain-containing protein n=1 Tax=Notodromas monacha TaxID=399045 RepID=A0A7R9BHY9_9CRUS|nr:unnamed protein product [Notodromas monacha]CAG0914246.1 unnamed protein product [Notodromas monacha]